MPVLDATDDNRMTSTIAKPRRRQADRSAAYSVQHPTRASRDQALVSLRPSTYLCVLCVKAYFNAEAAEGRRGSQRNCPN